MKILFYISISIALIYPAEIFADKASSANEQGIKAFNENKYDESAGFFTDAIVEKPDYPELKFNLGTALSEQNKTEEALRQLGAAADGFKNSSSQAAAHYNAGNTRFLAGDLEGAIEEYKRAVKLDQTSEDIRYNLEKAVRKWQEQQNQQQDKEKEEQQKEDGKKKEEGEDGQDTSGDDDNKEENKDEEESKDQDSKTSDSNEKEQQDQEKQQSKQQESEDRPMTPEEAKRILDALNDEEKKALSLRRMKMKTDMRQGDDW